MGTLAPFTDKHLLAMIADLPAELREDNSKRSFYLAIAVVKYFLGQEWFDQHVSWEKKLPDFCE